MKKSNGRRHPLASCIFALSGLLALPPAMVDAATGPAESPFLDIQWNSRVVRALLGTSAMLCQADPNQNSESVAYQDDRSWPQVARPSALRAMFYLAYDYHGMGLNHYFSLRQDQVPDFGRRFAGPRPMQGEGNTLQATPDFVAFKSLDRDTGAKALAGEEEVAAAPGQNATHIYFRHAVVDPFDLALLADQIRYYRLVSLSVTGQRKTPMDIEVPDPATSTLHVFEGRPLGLQSLESFTFPGKDRDHYTLQNMKPWADWLHAPYRFENDDFGEGLLLVGDARGGEVCRQWRLQQERERNGQASDTDRLLQALMERARVKDETALWVIPKGDQ